MFTVAFAVESPGPRAGGPAGLAEALAAVAREGGRSVVLTRADAAAAERALAGLRVRPDDVVPDVSGGALPAELRRRDAAVLVGGPQAAVPGVERTGLTGFPDWLDEWLLPGRLAALHERLAALPALLVAFSGGADSALVLAAAARALGPARVVAATAVSASLPGPELAFARRFAASLGVRHLAARTDELARAGYRANGPDRCYFCKAELMETLLPIARELGLPVVATGTNADDARSPFRPGIRAAGERGAITPLRDAGLTKRQVRAASRRWELVTWDKPAAACLSSRVAYGIEISAARLGRVERAEAALRDALRAAGLASRDLRVRDLGELARVEVDPELVPQLQARPELLAAVAGFAEVALDPRGFRSGSMNEALRGGHGTALS